MFNAENKIWYYVSKENERIGPVSIGELSALAGQGAISPATLVWNPDQTEWIPASKITDLLSATKPSQPPLSTPSTEAPPAASLPPQELKPRKGSFLFPRILATFFIAALFGSTLAGILFAIGESPWSGLTCSIFVFAFGLISGLAAYRKERYLIQDSRLVCHRGGLFSDEATELEIRNITHVKVRLPWLRYKFFRVGDVIVETAGSAKPMVMRAIRDPEEIYSGMRVRMKSNGYDLSERELLHEESPAFIGVLVECIGLLVGLFVFLVFSLGSILHNFDSFISVENPAIVASAASILLAFTVFIILRFLDLRRRTYRVFNDVVVYEEGFLTRQNTFIPYENIADSNTKRTFIDQILGLYDVLISCQGSSSEIKFRRLKNGDNLSAAIDHLVTSASKKPKAPKQSATNSSASRRPSRTEPESVATGNIRTAEYRINAARLLVPQLFLLPLFPLWILAMLKSLILLSSTRYFVRPGSLRHSYKFLTVDDREFSYDKITGIVIKRNLWDRWFNTMTLKFWSIGSGKALEFAHIHRDQIDLPAVMRQVGIPEASEESYNAETDFSVFTWVRARIWLALVCLAFAIVIIVTAILSEEPLAYVLLANPVLVITIGLVRAKLYYSRQRLKFYDHHIEAEQGVISKSFYYVRYKNVKRLSATRYPFGEKGELEIFVAGEEEVFAANNRGKQRAKPMLRQCSFTSGMLPRPLEAAALLDDILSGRIDPSPAATSAEPSEVLAESPRSVGNALFTLLLLSTLLFPLIILLPITIPLTILRVKRWRYRIENFRIVNNHGILFRSETSVLLDRVDSLQQSQGMLNKIFRNGKVSIMTAGSSKPDLVLSDAPEYGKLHDTIRENTET